MKPPLVEKLEVTVDQEGADAIEQELVHARYRLRVIERESRERIAAGAEPTQAVVIDVETYQRSR